MSAKPQNLDNQEIDLSQISKKIGNFFEGISTSIFKAILYVKKRLVLFIILFVVGASLGYYLDSSGKIYDNQIVVSPNFGSADYLYAKVNLLQSKIREQDTLFLKSIGIKKPSSVLGIEVKPIIDIYGLVASNTTSVSNAQNTQNFELIKLLSEDGDISKVITDDITSRNYGRHTIHVTSKEIVTTESVVEPLLNYLNQNDYYQNIQKTYFSNVKDKMKQNEGIIEQINNLLNQFADTTQGKGDKLVYYNENTQLNEIIQTKNNLILELGRQRMELINYDKVIRENDSVLNIRNKKGLNNKMKFVLPLFLILCFVGFNTFINFYKKQAAKLA